MNIFAISKSIGYLKQTLYNIEGFNSNEHKCYLKRELVRSWFEYGKRYTYLYELCVNNESGPIEINGTLFDNKIEYYLDTGSALAYGNCHEITLSGKTLEGEIFRTTYRWHDKYGKDLQTATVIIYSLILTSLFGYERIRKLFLNCFGQIKLEDKGLSDLILMIDEIKSIFEEVSEEYDFFGYLYQECMKHILEVTKIKLDEYKLLI